MAGNTGSPLCAELNRIANYGVYPDRDDFLEEQGAANVWAGTTGQGLLGALNYIVDPNRTDNNYKGLTAVCNELAGTTGLSDVDALRTINHPAEVLLKGTTARSASYYVDAATPRYNYPGYIEYTGLSGQYISVPDEAALRITGDIDLRAKVTLNSWTTNTAFIAKRNATTAYNFYLNASGTLSMGWSTDGTTLFSIASTVTTGLSDGATKWVRATFDVDNGAGGKTVTFYLSDDGVNWTQLGTATTQAGTTSMFASTVPVEIGSLAGGTTFNLNGKIYQAQIFSSLNGTNKVLDVDLTTNVTSATFNQFTATTGQLATINGQDTLTNGGTAGSLLPTTVGSSTSADSNDPKFLDHTGTNYVYLPGTITNYLEVPDAAALDITGDIDLRWYGALDDWTPATQNELLAKQTLSNRSYKIAINSTGFVTFQWSTDGSTMITAASSVATGVTDGAAKWVRVTLDVNNGASGNDVKFFLSDNGTSWTQLGSTVTNAGVTSIYVGTAPVRIGAIPDIGTTPLTGKVYRAQILNGIDGTTVLDVDTSVITAGAATSFTAVTGQTVTINRATSGRKTVAVTQPTWLFGTDDYMEVNNRYMAHSTAAENYVYLSGNSGNYMSVADNPPLDITGDLDLRVQAALDDWTPAASTGLVAKWLTTGNQRSYRLDLNTSGNLVLFWSTNGTAVNSQTSTAALSLTDGAVKWVRATIDIDNGASGHDIKFWTSDNGTTWTQLGTTIVGAGTTSIYSGTATLDIGAIVGGSPAKGKFYRAQVLNGIDGTIVLDADASVITLPSQTTFVDRSSNAYTVTINKSGVGTFVSTGNYMYLPGISTNYASVPDSAALDITGDIDLRVKVAMDDWTPSAINVLLAKRPNGSSQQSYFFYLNTDGTISIGWTTDGATLVTKGSTVATGIADGVTKWVRATLDVDNGASGNSVQFFTSDDGLTWTQLGSTVVTAGVTSIYSGTGILEIGSQFTGASAPARGKFFRAQVLSGIAGTVAFDANFENSITSLLQTTFTESSTNGATVTINRSGSTFRSAGVIDAGYLYPGATNTFALSTTDFLNFGATDSFSVLAVVRQWNTPVNGGLYISKRDGGSVNVGYEVYPTTSNTQFLALDDGPNAPLSSFTNATIGSLLADVGVVNRTTQTTTFYTNATTNNSPASISTLGSLSNIGALSIGRRPAGSSGAGGLYQDFELIGAAVFRTVLTPKNISDITNYFNGRD